MLFALGFISGLLFSILAVIVGKKLSVAINDPAPTIPSIQKSVQKPQAQIIKNKDVIEEFLNEN